MEISSKIKESFDNIKEAIEGQQWYQELNSKWEELDPQSKTYLKFAAFGSFTLFLIVIVVSYMWGVHSLKRELSEKQALLTTLQSANDELNQLKGTLPSEATGGGKETGPWPTYFESLATAAGVDKSAISVSPEKSGAGISSDMAKESLFDISLKHVNIKQVVRYSFSLENSQRPIKLRNLLIDTKSDPSGYMDATLSVSAFILMEPKQ